MVMPNNTYWYCLPELVQRSLLWYNRRTEHFEFHRLIKEFFLYRSHLEPNSVAIQRTFNVNFQFDYAHWLSERAHQFSHGHKSALGALDTEKHNIRYFLDGVIDHLEPRNSVTVISALITALDENFLNCHFSIDDLHDVAKSATKYLQHNYKRMDIDPNTLFIAYVKLVCDWAMCRRQQHNISSALNILTSHQEHIEFLYARTDKSLVAAQYNIVFYSELSAYYEVLGLHHQVLTYQVKILETTDSLKNCEPDSCNYFDIGISYLKAGDNHQGVKYLELALQQPHELLRDELRHAHSLTWLHDGYIRIGATAKEEQVLATIVTLLLAVVQHDVTVRNKYMFEDLIRFYIKVGKNQEAGVLQEKILQILIELHESGDQRTAQYAKKLALFLYSIGNYTKAADIGHLTIEHLESGGLGRDLEMARMLVLVGKSQPLAWDVSGLSYFDAAINLIEEMEYSSNTAQVIAREACMFCMWRMDIKCIWKVSHYRLKSCEALVNNVQKISPRESISTAITDYNQNNFLLALPVSNIALVQHIQSLLIGLGAHGLVVRYCACIVLTLIILFLLTCWPCLTCGCIICTSVSHCCCCSCYVFCVLYLRYVRFRTWVWVCKWHCIVLLPLLIATYYPIVVAAILLVGYIIFLIVFFSFNSLVIYWIVYSVIKDPIIRECLVLEIFLYIVYTTCSDSDTI